MPERPNVGTFDLKHDDEDLEGPGDSYEAHNQSSFSYQGSRFTMGDLVFGGINSVGANTVIGDTVFPNEPILGMVVYARGQFYTWTGFDWEPISIGSDDGTLRININTGVLEYLFQGQWFPLGPDLPTVDPGNGGLWLDGV